MATKKSSSRKTKSSQEKSATRTEPKVQVLTQWGGMNIHKLPQDFNYFDLYTHPETDLMQNFMHVQNNVLCNQGTLETREPLVKIYSTPARTKLTGVAHLWGKRLFVSSVSDSRGQETVYWKDLDSGGLVPGGMVYAASPTAAKTTHINHHGNTLFIFDNSGKTRVTSPGINTSYLIRSYLPLNDPVTAPTITPVGDIELADAKAPAPGTWGGANCFHRIAIKYCYTNEFGNTLPSPGVSHYYTHGPADFSTLRYLKISGPMRNQTPSNYPPFGVNIYCKLDDNQQFILIGHVDVPSGSTWEYNWMGAMVDVASLMSSSLMLPTMNTTEGPNARFMDKHDGRLFFYGSPLYPHRLYIGGNPGNEKSYDRGNGGGFVDIEPGSGRYITGTEKFKTYMGASIVTATTGSPNSSEVDRYNILDDTVEMTNEIQFKAWQTQRVAGAHGTNSFWGHLVAADGMYCVNRYGLSVVTQAMESQNQIRAAYVSENVDYVWLSLLANQLDNARMVCIDDIIYIAMTSEAGTELERVLFCYDINTKAWWTYTIDEQQTDNSPILHIMHIDWEGYREGLGIVCQNGIYLLPTTNPIMYNVPDYVSLLETGEMSQTIPLQNTNHISQLEFRFDYLIGDITIQLIGVDYYGRLQTITKIVSQSQIRHNWSEYMRVDMWMECYKLIIIGQARYRMTHIIVKQFPGRNKIGLAWGQDDSNLPSIHHYLRDYNNLRDNLMP